MQVAATFAGSVYWSANGGATWAMHEQRFASSGVLGGAVGALVVDPVTPTTLYLGADEVYRSTDVGFTWNQLAALSDGRVQAIAIDPSAPNRIYAGTFGGSVHKSTDAGASWNAVLDVGASGVSAIVLDPSNPSIVYVRTAPPAATATTAHAMISASQAPVFPARATSAPLAPSAVESAPTTAAAVSAISEPLPRPRFPPAAPRSLQAESQPQPRPSARLRLTLRLRLKLLT